MMINAVLIDPENQKISDVDIEAGNLEQIYELLGCRVVDFVMLYPNGDGVFIDDEGMLIEDQYFFHHINNDYSIAGKALLVGTGDDGETVAPDWDAESLNRHITFLGDREKVARIMRLINHVKHTKTDKEYVQ